MMKTLGVDETAFKYYVFVEDCVTSLVLHLLNQLLTPSSSQPLTGRVDLKVVSSMMYSQPGGQPPSGYGYGMPPGPRPGGPPPTQQVSAEL